MINRHSSVNAPAVHIIKLYVNVLQRNIGVLINMITIKLQQYM